MATVPNSLRGASSLPTTWISANRHCRCDNPLRCRIWSQRRSSQNTCATYSGPSSRSSSLLLRSG